MKPFFVMIFTILTSYPGLIKSQKSPEKPADFLPPQIWSDKNGNAIKAHGGGVLFLKGFYYYGI
jgi:hypothetical protein